jgi:osmotically inducible protein OsmC
MKMASGAYEGQYSANSRFEEGVGTNPEELIAAAHAGCFSMAFSAGLGRAGFTPDSINTTAKVHITKKPEGGWIISKIELETEASVPGIEDAQFQEIAESSKKGCPVSVALGAVETITVNAKLV